MRRLACLLTFAVMSHAELHRLNIEDRINVLEGQSFGGTGSYERIKGRAHFRIDPANSANKAVVDLRHAPKNAQGQVEFSADFYMLKPRDPAKANGTVLFEVVNRGGKGMLRHFNFARTSQDPITDEDLGDKFLLEQGFTLAWLGWQWDVADKPGYMKLHAPRASGVTGVVRSEFVPTSRVDVMSLADRDHTPYEAADGAPATLTVRELFDRGRTTIPPERWKFVDGGHIRVEGGLQPGLIYEMVYTAKDPAIAGLGFAAVRDLISALKNGGLPGEKGTLLKRAIGIGTSQSGRFLRAFLYDGFNADEKGRKVFDGVWPHVAGAGRGSFNMRFAQPSRDAQPWTNFFYPTDIFPFTDTEQTVTEGLKGGLLGKATAAGVVPKIFYTNGSYEYWGRAASLIHTTVDGRQDVSPAPDTRIYFLTGMQHGPGSFPPSEKTARYPANPNDYSYIMRALLVGLNNWLKDGAEPPKSAYPTVKDGQLVRPAQLKFPAVPNVQPPTRAVAGYRLDYGPHFEKDGVITQEPPRVVATFEPLIPALDANGNEIAGIRLPEIQHPLGTYTGWNYRLPETGARGEMIAFIGSFFRLPPAQAGDDPRAPIAARYPGRQEYLAKIEASARELSKAGYVLPRDIPALKARGERMWETLAGGRP